MRIRLIDARTGKETSKEQIENELLQIQDDLANENEAGILNILLNRRDSLNDCLDFLIEASREPRNKRDSNKISIASILSKRK